MALGNSGKDPSKGDSGDAADRLEIISSLPYLYSKVFVLTFRSSLPVKIDCTLCPSGIRLSAMC